MHQRFLFTCCLGILFCSLFFAHPVLAAKVIQGFSHPESITIDSTQNRIFVSNIGKEMKPTAKDGDGFISEVLADGTIVKKHLTPQGTLNAPKGIAVVDDVIYVADIDRVVGFDINSGNPVFSWDFSQDTTFLNDLIAIEDRILLVSASDTGAIYQISLGDRKITDLRGHVPGANGIAYNAETKTVYAVGLGENFNGKGNLYQLALSEPDAEFELIHSSSGFLDGIALLDNSHIIYSDWVDISKPTPGTIYLYDLSSKQTTTLALPIKISSPADFYYQKYYSYTSIITGR